MEDRLQPKTAPQCTREPYTAGVLEAPAGYSGQAARTGRTAFMSGPVFGDRSQCVVVAAISVRIKLLRCPSGSGGAPGNSVHIHTVCIFKAAKLPNEFNVSSKDAVPRIFDRLSRATVRLG